MWLLIGIPVCCFGLILLSIHRRAAQLCWREAFLGAAIAVGLFIVLSTELLSLLNLIVFPAVLLCWLAVLAGAAALWYRAGRPERAWQPVRAIKEARLSAILVAGLAAYILATGLIAVIAPPNTWDSLEYHMPKVVHWMQNHNVSFYPTAIPRQNHQNPGAEYVILHLQLLTGSDRFANLVEWFSMIGSLVAVSLLAKRLGAGPPSQLLAAVFAATLPMGIMQASSTQTDYVVAFWLSCFVYYMLGLIRSEALEWRYLLALSAALGLAVFTKATAYLYAPAFLIWMALSLFRARRFRAVKPLLASAAILLAISSGHYIRNYQLHGNPLGPGEEPLANSKYSNDTFTPPAIASGVVRNVATHLQTPWPAVNTAFENAVVGFHEVIGHDVNDRRTTWGPETRVRFSIRATMFHDEVDGNPLHLLVAIVCCVLMLVVARLRKQRDLLTYTLCVLVAFVSFAAYVKWSPWNSRVHMSVFVLAAPLCAVVLTTCFRQRIVNTAALVLLVCGIPWILNCQLRPLVGTENIFNTSRISLFFKNPGPPDTEQWYLNGWDFLKNRNVANVGLITTNSSWEYIWWVLLRQENPDVRIEHVNVEDVSRRFYEEDRFPHFQPDAVVSLQRKTSELDSITVSDQVYARQWSEGATAIFTK